jgi:RimJ/RimL family protein N-acetyltransferase
MVEIETKRLVLRPIGLLDAVDVAMALGDFEVTKNLSRVPYPYRESDAVEWINMQPKSPTPQNTNFVVRGHTGKFCGVVGFDEGEIGPEIGYYLARPMWGKGFMSEAASAAIAWQFEQTDETAIISGAYLFNPASLAIQYKLGFENTHVEDRDCIAQNQAFPLQVTKLERSNFKPTH